MYSAVDRVNWIHQQAIRRGLEPFFTAGRNLSERHALGSKHGKIVACNSPRSARDDQAGRSATEPAIDRMKVLTMALHTISKRLRLLSVLVFAATLIRLTQRLHHGVSVLSKTRFSGRAICCSRNLGNCHCSNVALDYREKFQVADK